MVVVMKERASEAQVDAVIARLRNMGVDMVYVDYPGLDDLDRHLTPYLSPARQKVYSQIKETIGACQKRSRAGVSYNDYYASTRDMVLTLPRQWRRPVSCSATREPQQ